MIPVVSDTPNEPDTQQHSSLVDLSWQDVSFSTKGIDILSDCWGRVSAGTLCAIMGRKTMHRMQSNTV